jgi:hypothetical protein
MGTHLERPEEEEELPRDAIFLAVALAWTGAGSALSVMPPPPEHPELLLQRELQRTLAETSSCALIMFIARNPDEAVTDKARQALAARRQPDTLACPGPDGDIVAAFDRARLAGDGVLDAFAIRYANHPLGIEAMRPFWH